MTKAPAMLLALASATMAMAQAADYEKHVFEQDGKALPYRLLVPANIEAGKVYPLVIFLHGAGERGADNQAQLVHGSRLFLDARNRDAYPAYVLFPQCPKGRRWVEVDWGGKTPHAQPAEPSEPMALTRALVDRLVQDRPVDRRRIYVMGLSMGGYGTWDFAARYPELTAAAVPICGGADDSLAPRLKDIPVWAFHGAADTVVWPQRSRSAVEALKQAGGDVRYSEYDKVNHLCWGRAFAEPDLLPWMFAKKKP